MTPTEKDIIRIAEEQVLEFYEKYNVPLEERKNFNGTAQKAISNNIPNLAKAIKERQSQRKERIIKIVCWTLIILSMIFIYSGL